MTVEFQALTSVRSGLSWRRRCPATKWEMGTVRECPGGGLAGDSRCSFSAVGGVRRADRQFPARWLGQDGSAEFLGPVAGSVDLS